MRKVIVLFALLLLAFPLLAGDPSRLTLASTTSTLDSGLFDALIPAFEKKFSCKVKVIAVGTGQALRLGRDGNADVLLVHDPEGEKAFVNEGFGRERLSVMHNAFAIVGPSQDPAKIRRQPLDIAFERIVATGAPFVSRGDQSGTHKKELKLWSLFGGKKSSAYLESGSGMEATLRIALERQAYTLTDMATWLAHRKELDGLSLLVENDQRLYNPYSVILINPVKYPDLNHPLAEKFVQWIRGKEGQKIIRNFGVDRFGFPLFFPDVITR